MKKKEALALVEKSVPLAKDTDIARGYDYSVWLAFVEEYKDISFSKHSAKLEKLFATYHAR